MRNLNTAILLAIIALPLSASAATYTFNNLIEAPLDGQDGWTGNGINNVFATSGNYGTNGIETNAVDTFGVSARSNDGNFSFPALSPTGTYNFQFDFRTTDASAGGYQAATFNVGAGNGLPSFGVDGIGPTNNLFYIRAENATEFGGGLISSAPGFDNGDWVQLRLTVDFAANAGAGSGSYSYRNLTDGDAGYTNVAGLQNINLGITTNPATWDTMRLRTIRPGGIGTQVDNLAIAPVQTSEIYTFEGLNPGNLVGQDNWHSSLGGGRDQTVQAGTGVNPSTVAGAPDAGAGLVARINNVDYGFTPYFGTETAATLQFDVTLAAAGGPHFALAHDTNNSGAIDAGNEISAAFGIANGGKFYIRGAGFGAETEELVGLAGSVGDWFRMQLVVDFTANGGNGLGSLFYRNLTLGQTSFTPVATMQAVNLQLLNGPTPSSWDALWVRTDGGGLYDNLNPNVVPEPNSFALLAAGLIGLIGCKRRKVRTFSF